MSGGGVRRFLLVSLLALVGLSTPCLASEGGVRTFQDYESSLDYSCETDADCTVKDRHNCCGYYPACMNVSARPDHDLVEKLCQREGLASVCGFPDISSCQCVDGRCAPAGRGSSLSPEAGTDINSGDEFSRP